MLLIYAYPFSNRYYQFEILVWVQIFNLVCAEWQTNLYLSGWFFTTAFPAAECGCQIWLISACFSRGFNIMEAFQAWQLTGVQPVKGQYSLSELLVWLQTITPGTASNQLCGGEQDASFGLIWNSFSNQYYTKVSLLLVHSDSGTFDLCKLSLLHCCKDIQQRYTQCVFFNINIRHIHLLWTESWLLITATSCLYAIR